MSIQKSKYTIKFVESLKSSENIDELPKESLQHIAKIDKELNKYFKFLLDKKPYQKKKYNGDKKYGDNSWRIAKGKRKKLFANDDKSPFERDITLSLNKINVKNYEEMKKIIFEKCKEKNVLEYTVENMFKKAVSQPSFCDCYVKLYKDMIAIEDGSKDYLVSKLISEKCDSYLDIFSDEIKDDESIDENDYDKFCELNKQKDYVKGYSQFIAVLVNNSIIDIDKINLFVDSILNNININKKDENTKVNTEEYINSLYILIKCIGNKIYEINDYADKKVQFQNYSKDKELTSKGKFKFMDICDLLKK